MAEKKPTPRGTKVVAGALVGGLVAVGIGQRTSPWVLASQLHTIVVVVAGVAIGGLIMLFATKPKA